MQRDLEEFTKVVSEDATSVYSKVAEVTYQSINDYAGEDIAQDAVNMKSVRPILFFHGNIFVLLKPYQAGVVLHWQVL